MNNPRLPGYVSPTAVPPFVPPRAILSRPTATQINRATTEAREISMTLAGFDEVVPFTFGEDRISGLWLVRPYTHIASGHLRFAILWGEGPALGPQEIYINGAAVPGSVVMTHYTGTEDQPIDPTLQADIAGFADRYPFLSYTVFSVPPGTISGFPQTARIECVFRGLLTYDERTDTTYWSENPGLAIGEWLRSTRFGPGINAIGVADVADRCDSIVSGVEPRCRMGITFANPIDLEAMMNLLSSYAECLWSFSGDDVLLVPDAPVEFIRNSPATYWDRDLILRTAPPNTPRFGYDPVTGEEIGLILEDEAVNIIRNSESGWITINSVVEDGFLGPDGTLSALKVTHNNLGSATALIEKKEGYPHGEFRWYATIFVKKGNTDVVTLNCYYNSNPESNLYFNLENMEVTGNAVEKLIFEKMKNGWFRIGYLIPKNTNPSTAFFHRVWPGRRNQGQFGDYCYVFGAQLERDKPTSYIKTGPSAERTVRYKDENVGGISFIDRSQIVGGTLFLRGSNLGSSPTEITVTYRVDTGTAEQWRESSLTESIPGVDEGEVQAIRSDVNMPGIHRVSEAYRKAVFRLRRLQRPGRYEWQMSGIGIKIQQGDVVVLPDTRGMISETVRVLSAEMIDRGIYQFTGERYDPLMYPDETPNSEVNVPVGFIAWGNAIDTPFGWERFTAADGYNLRGCNPGDEGQIAGSNTISHSGVSSSSGAHAGERDMFLVAPSIFQTPAETPSSSPAEPPHNHTYSLNTTISGAYRRQRAFIKTGDPGSLPSGVMVLARKALLDASFQAVLSHVGRILGNAETPSQGGSNSQTVTLTTSHQPDHTHLDSYRRAGGSVGFGVPLATPKAAGGHSHPNSSVTVSASIRRRRMMLFQNNVNDKGIIPGTIGGYMGDVNNLLPGWHVCDGSNGTVNLVDHFIAISDEGQAGSAIGNDTYSFSGNLRPDGAHGHSESTTPTGVEAEQFNHANTVPNHTHSISGSGSHTPRHYKMVFIEYTGVV